MLPEYDVRGGVRGKYAPQLAEGTTLVLIEPDLALIFRTSEAVNRALRKILEMGYSPTEDE